VGNFNCPNWKAYWIWQKDNPAKPNTYVYFRRSFPLKNKPSKAICYVSADTSYRLFINGKFVGNGPILTEPRWQSYDSYNISDFLCKGKNVVSAIVYHFGNAIDNPDGWTMNWSHGGFLCQIDMENNESIITDSSWDVLESSAWDNNSPKMDSMTYAEMHDARKETGNWLEPGFPNKNWVSATVVTADEKVKQWMRNPTPSKVLPWVQLEPRSIPYFVHEEKTPKAIMNSGEILELAEPNSIDVAIRMSLEEILPFKHTSITNMESLLGLCEEPAKVNPMDDNISYDDFKGVYDPVVILDVGKLINGRVSFDIESHAGAMIDIGYGQILVNGRVIPYLSRRTILADQYITKEGRQSFETFNWRHFRYVQMTFRKMQKPIKIHKIKMISESYPVERIGNFECSDEMLNWLWRACVETTHLCIYDRLMDNPFRERREYTGDVTNILHGIYAGFGDIDIIKKYFKDVKRGQMLYGVIPSAVLGQKREPNRIFIDGGIFILRLWEHYELYGNKEILEDMFQTVYSHIKHLEGYTDENGLINQLPYPIFIDWSDIDLRGNSLCINALFAQSMKIMSCIADVMGKTDVSREYKEKYKKLSDIISSLFWDRKRGVFVDAIIDGKKSEHVSEHANFLMILFGFANHQQTKLIIKFIRDPSLKVGQIEPLYYWVSESLFKAGEGKLALDMMRKRYGRIRKQGLDTISELWNLHGERYTGRWRSRDSRSAVQSGGVSAAYFLTKYVLGISPLKHGFEEVLIAPQLCDLSWARGSWPSPNGNINVIWDKTQYAFNIECQLPNKMKGKLILPSDIFPIKSLKINNRKADIKEIKDKSIQICGNIKIKIAI